VRERNPAPVRGISYSVVDLLLPLLAGLLGAGAIALRPPTTFAALGITAAAGAVGLLAPLPRLGSASARSTGSATTWWWLVVTAVGCAAFAAGRALTHPLAPPPTAGVLSATVVAAVAEELLFRRLLYGCLARWGPAVAIAGSSAVFAAVHVPAYGAAVFLLDLAAGALLGWQRWASGGWTAPAVTHVLANVLQGL